MSNKIFHLVEETSDQVIVKVDAKDPLTVARHPYVTAQMAYITVTRGDNHIFTIVYDDGHTWSCEYGTRGYTLIGENTQRLRSKLLEYLDDQHVFLDAHTELNPYAARFYAHEGCWFVDFEFCDTKTKGRKYFDVKLYPTPKELVERAFVEYNELFKEHKEITEEPNWNVGTVYHVEIGEEW